MTDKMAYTKGHGFVVGESFDDSRLSLRWSRLVGRVVITYTVW